MKFKLTIYPALEAGNPSVSYRFETLKELNAAKDTCADLLIFLQDKAKVMNDYSNMFLKESLSESGEWLEIDEMDDEDYFTGVK